MSLFVSLKLSDLCPSSSLKNFDESLGKAKRILDNNQYPSAFYEPIIEKTLIRIIENKAKNDDEEEDQEKKCFSSSTREESRTSLKVL